MAQDNQRSSPRQAPQHHGAVSDRQVRDSDGGSQREQRPAMDRGHGGMDRDGGLRDHAGEAPNPGMDRDSGGR